MLFGCDQPGDQLLKDGQGVLYQQNAEGSAYVVMGRGDFEGANLVIPGTFNGMPVIGIAKCAFLHCDNLVSVSIPASVQYIGEEAFTKCDELTTFNISDGSVLESIGAEAFYGCAKLGQIAIPATVKSIGFLAFSGCSSLESAVIPDNSVLESIGSLAFNECAVLGEINVPDSVISIGTSAFLNCTALEYNVSGGGKYLGSVENPYTWFMGVTSTSVSELSVEEGCKHLYGFALNGCSALQSLKLPNSLISIESKALEGASGLVYNVDGMGKYLGNDTNPYLVFVGLADSSATEVAVNDDCEMIAPYALGAGASLTAVTIGESVRYIGQYVFLGANSVQSVTFRCVEGWIAGSVEILSTELSNTETAKQYVLSKYGSVEWKRS